ncbi:MAG TPA: hypothetical protein VKB88_28940 [Bryobacteraceae bacterium]|nr:hypothetical protein [Bryobacteraceae bacterium]
MKIKTAGKIITVEMEVAEFNTLVSILEHAALEASGIQEQARVFLVRVREASERSPEITRAGA